MVLRLPLLVGLSCCHAQLQWLLAAVDGSGWLLPGAMQRCLKHPLPNLTMHLCLCGTCPTACLQLPSSRELQPCVDVSFIARHPDVNLEAESLLSLHCCLALLSWRVAAQPAPFNSPE